MRVDRVASRADLRAFCDLPLRLHPRGCHVPLPSSTIATHARTTELYLVRADDGTVVGRTSVHRDAAFDAKVGPHQLFGHTEFVDDDAVVAALVDTVTARPPTSGTGSSAGSRATRGSWTCAARARTAASSSTTPG